MPDMTRTIEIEVFKLETKIDLETLQDFAVEPEKVRARILYLETLLEKAEEPIGRVRVLGEAGGLCRMLRRLDDAEKYLARAMALILKNRMGSRHLVIYGIRLAHVYQWRGDFVQSTDRFSEVVELCREKKDCEDLLDFALQHAGKNFFDQKIYESALPLFEEALELRNEKADAELIESTEIALNRTREMLKGPTVF